VFNQILSSLGFGGATIDTRLHHNLRPGQVEATFESLIQQAIR
jgi:hypothetical protein